MLFDELYEQLKNLEPDITTISAYWNNASLEKQFQELNSTVNQEEFWKNPDQAKISKELQRVRVLREQYDHITNTHTELGELITLFEDDESVIHQRSHSSGFS